MFPVWDTLLVSKCTQIYGLPICIDLYYIVVVKIVNTEEKFLFTSRAVRLI